MRPRQEGEVRFCQLFRVRWEVHGFVFSGYLLACWSCLEEFVTPFLPGKLLASCETNVLPPKPARKAVSPSSKCSEPIPLTQAAFHASGMCFWIGISCHAVVGGTPSVLLCPPSLLRLGWCVWKWSARCWFFLCSENATIGWYFRLFSCSRVIINFIFFLNQAVGLSILDNSRLWVVSSKSMVSSSD